MVPNVPAIDRVFDYDLSRVTDAVGVGDQVRVNLHGRSVRGWVSEIVAPDRALKPVTRWLGLGPPARLVDVCAWAARRWAGPLARFLTASSPPTIVTALPAVPVTTPVDASEPFEDGVARVAPDVDPLPQVLALVAAAHGRSGSVLVLVPSEAWASRLSARLARRGVAVASASEWAKCRAGWPVIVGARGAAFAPTPHLAGAVVVDGDDERFRSEAAPTWHVVDVVLERCARDGAPWRVTSPLPSPALAARGLVRVSSGEAAWWPHVEVADRRVADPHDGALLAPTLARARDALAGGGEVAVAVILQRLGTGRLLACAHCRELAQCPACGAAERSDGDELICPSDGSRRPKFCARCGGTRLRVVQSGVTTLARDVAAQLATAVTEVTTSTPTDAPLDRVVVGTEAVLHRVRRSTLVVFADFDQYLLAPRARARRDAVYAVARAGRIVGGRGVGRGAVVLQTRRDDAVVRALVTGSLDELAAEEDDIARVLRLPPYGAVAHLSGTAAEEYATNLSLAGLEVQHGDVDVTVRAPTIDALCELLATTARPAGQLRVAVD